MKILAVGIASLTALTLQVSHRTVRSSTFTATAYCLRSTTATGTRTGYGTIAVDPHVIPLHRRLYVQGYGWGRALDTGGAIHGYRVDLWMTCRAAYRWGVRRVRVRW